MVDTERTRPHDDGPPALIDWDETGHVATLTLNRPSARNALDRRLAAELLSSLRTLADRSELRTVVLT